MYSFWTKQVLKKHWFLVLKCSLDWVSPVQRCTVEAGERALSTQLSPVLLGPLVAGTEIPITNQTDWSCGSPWSSRFSLLFHLLRKTWAEHRFKGTGHGKQGKQAFRGTIPRGIYFVDCKAFLFTYGSHFLLFKSLRFWKQTFHARGLVSFQSPQYLHLEPQNPSLMLFTLHVYAQRHARFPASAEQEYEVVLTEHILHARYCACLFDLY